MPHMAQHWAATGNEVALGTPSLEPCCLPRCTLGAVPRLSNLDTEGMLTTWGVQCIFHSHGDTAPPRFQERE